MRLIIIVWLSFCISCQLSAQNGSWYDGYWDQILPLYQDTSDCSFQKKLRGLQNPLTFVKDIESRRNLQISEYPSGYLEFAVFILLAPNLKVDSVWIETVNMDASWTLITSQVLQEEIDTWAPCDVPVSFSDRSWVILLPYSLLPIQNDSNKGLHGPPSNELLQMIGDYTSTHLTKLFPVARFLWGSIE